jgi:hypothetical protein
MKKKDLAFSEAKNELVFEGKRTQIKAEMWPKNRPWCGFEREFGGGVSYEI